MASRASSNDGSGGAKKDRSITSYPPALYPDATPYRGINFHPKVREAAQQAAARTSTPKLTKAVVVGDTGVGKTCLVHRFVHECFQADYKATIGVDFEVERFSVLSTPFNLQLWDTAGQERFKCIAASYYRGANAILTVFDMTNNESLQNARTWMEEACENIQMDSPLKFLVGSKKDLLALKENAGTLQLFMVGEAMHTPLCLKSAYFGDTMSKFHNILDSCFKLDDSETQFRNVEARALHLANDLKAEFWTTSSKSGDNVQEFFFRLVALLFDGAILREQETPAPGPKTGVGNNIRMSRIDADDDKHKSKQKCCK